METTTIILPTISAKLGREADSDQQLLELWLHGRPATTQRVYRSDVDQFFCQVRKSLHEVTLRDLQLFSDSLGDRSLKPTTCHRMLSTVKSVFAFAHRLGYLTFDVARPLRLPPLRDSLAERILSEAEIQRMLVLERQPRNHAILYLLYAAGIRVSECCRLKWRDLCERDQGGQVSIFGKGGKTNVILLPDSVWRMVVELRGGATEDAAVFRSRKGSHLHPSQVFRIVQAATRRAGIARAVSPHWMRHAHASHALDRGAPIHLVQATLNHSSVATTGKYLHARPSESSAKYLAL